MKKNISIEGQESQTEKASVPDKPLSVPSQNEGVTATNISNEQGMVRRKCGFDAFDFMTYAED